MITPHCVLPCQYFDFETNAGGCSMSCDVLCGVNQVKSVLVVLSAEESPSAGR